MNADKAWQIAVTTRFDYCERCHRVLPLSGHHAVPRRYKRIEHDIKNGISLCYTCHLWCHAYPKLQKRFNEITIVHRGDFKTIKEYREYIKHSKWSTDRPRNKRINNT